MTKRSAQDAIPELFSQHAGTIYNLGLRMCPGPDEAQDLVQETFMRAYRGWDQFEGRASPSTWLWTIAVRACTRMKRRRAGEPDHMDSLESLLPSPGDEIPDAAAVRDTNALDALVRQELQDSVDRAIAELPEPFRMALVLKDIAGLTLGEVAEVLDVKEATIKTRVHRARLAVRAAVAKPLPSFPPPNENHERHVCLDLLHGKLEALDRGVAFPVPDEELCTRCQSLFATLDLTRDLCATIRSAELPESVSALLQKRFQTGDHAAG